MLFEITTIKRQNSRRNVELSHRNSFLWIESQELHLFYEFLGRLEDLDKV